MRRVLSQVGMDGTVVIGEGEKDEAPMLFCGERIGTGSGLKVDIAVDPLDGTTLVATGRDGAVAVRRCGFGCSGEAWERLVWGSFRMWCWLVRLRLHSSVRLLLFDHSAAPSATYVHWFHVCVCTPRLYGCNAHNFQASVYRVQVIALAERGALYDPGPCMYMEKLAAGPGVPPSALSLDAPIATNLQAVSKALGKPVADVTVLILDRLRHESIIAEARAAGARIRLISDGDVGGAIETAKPDAPVDLMLGIGGALLCVANALRMHLTRHQCVR